MKQNFTVRQGALDGVEAFLSVAQHRSFRRAAAELGVTPSAISQAVRALEARVGAALFMRTTRSVGLTEAGERFLSRAKPAFEELVAASEVARDLGQRPAGLLRLSVPRAVVPILLEPLIASFCQAYPEVEVEIAASEELVDLVAEGFDAGIRLGQFIAPDMVVVRLTPPFHRRRRARRYLRRRPDIGCARIVQRYQALYETSPCSDRRRPLRRLRRAALEQLHLSDPAERHLRQRLTANPLSDPQRAARPIVGEMAHEDVGVPNFREVPKLFRDFVDRSRDQGFCRNAAIALAQSML
jgi:DNA-binding transcriptional LysR family regulator